MGKLIRDCVPETIRAAGGFIETRRLGDDEYRRALREKVVEEAGEVASAGSRAEMIEELGDLLETVRALATHERIALADIELAAAQKRREYGGFEGRTFSVSFEPPPQG